MAAKKVREEFLEGASAIAEDSAQARYLRSRGHSGPIPAALRCGGKGGFIVNGVFTPALPYYHGGVRVDDTPAMGAEITQPDGTVAGVHVTYLTEDGHKARVPQAKKVHGHKDGGAIRLTGAGPVLALTEGIETALAILKARPDLAVWAAVDAGNIAKQVLPPVVRHVLICADNDASETGLRKAQAAADRFLEEGRTVSIALPPETGTDFNDVLLRQSAAAVRALIEQAEPWDGTKVAEDARPHYDVEPMSVDAASAALEKEVRSFVESEAIRAEVRQAQAEAVRQALAAHPALDPAHSLAVGICPATTKAYRTLLGQAKQQARKAVLARHGLRRLPERERLQIAADAGIGKTQAVIEAVAAREVPLVAHAFVPTHKLADGLAVRFEKARVRAYVIRGRTAVGPDGRTMCHKPMLAEALGKAGANVKKSLCKNEHGQCEHYGRCPFMRQVSEIETGGRPTAIIMRHEYLTMPKPEGLPKADFAVVDESPVGTLCAHKTLKLADLGRPEHWKDVPESAMGELADFLATCRVIGDAFKEVNGTVRLGRVSLPPLDAIEAVAAFAKEHAGAVHVAGLPTMDEDAGCR